MFLELPPELRLMVYRIITQRTIVTKDTIAFHPEDSEAERRYRGLIFSCKSVMMKYKAEAAKAVLSFDSIQELLTFSQPLLVAPPSATSLPTHIQITMPITFFRSGYLSAMVRMMPTLVAHRTKITFSLSQSTSIKSTLSRGSYLVRLYNSLCEIVAPEFPEFPGLPSSLFSHRFSRGTAKKMWREKGHVMAVGDTAPFWSCAHVTLHVQQETVVFDAHMSGAELRGADSGHLWEDQGAWLQREATLLSLRG